MKNNTTKYASGQNLIRRNAQDDGLCNRATVVAVEGDVVVLSWESQPWVQNEYNVNDNDDAVMLNSMVVVK